MSIWDFIVPPLAAPEPCSNIGEGSVETVQVPQKTGTGAAL